ncbi:hypothetical protein KPH14_008951 [Odynerus spinipes]|uniref:Uncharacterized protein n=1 Tax=Odynerus spinipes TaxID=1348599 RepID=A0AAD9VQ48_9HYME|nr:hypothetical protein KPH14_008951 [Odynerus spinipes]
MAAESQRDCRPGIIRLTGRLAGLGQHEYGFHASGAEHRASRDSKRYRRRHEASSLCESSSKSYREAFDIIRDKDHPLSYQRLIASFERFLLHLWENQFPDIYSGQSYLNKMY